jgi:hypothetical protein
MGIRRSPLQRLDGALFVFAGLSVIWLAYLLVREGDRPGWQVPLLLVFWVLVTYLVLPRLHRILTRIYVPGYFIGRTRTSDGLLGDPVNLALIGDEAQLHLAMVRAGWSRADDLRLRSGLHIVRSTLRRRSYVTAPVSPLLLFERQQDFAYQQEVSGSPSRRHHVRFWRVPEGWLLPGGYAVGWLAAGTYDRSVGLSLFTLQITHKIEANTDIERDHVVGTLSAANPEVVIDVIRDFSTGYHSRNGGGDLIQTDGDLPIIDLRRVHAMTPSAVEATDSRKRRPAQVVFGATASVLRGLFVLVAGVLVVVSPADLAVQSEAGAGTRQILIGLLYLLLAFCDIGLALLVMFGRNWARIVLMLFSAAAIVAAFIDNVNRLDLITLETLPTVAISVLILLALSSYRARDYAMHHRRGRRLIRSASVVV